MRLFCGSRCLLKDNQAGLLKRICGELLGYKMRTRVEQNNRFPDDKRRPFGTLNNQMSLRWKQFWHKGAQSTILIDNTLKI